AHPGDRRVEALSAAAAGRFAALAHGATTAPSFEIAEAVSRGWPLLSQVGLAWLVAHPRERSERPFEAAQFGPAMRAGADAGHAASATALFDLLYEIERLRGALDRLFERCDVLLTPAAAALPRPAHETQPPR